ncbi:MAG TPA: phytoene/squalene synthase family protein [Jiangellales bacterium]|nr:phytoene/squalene synthase family protein [Jiangellales bacterium]
MSARELDAAGISDPLLRESYEACRRLNAAHGKTYYLATLLLPPEKRPYVHALYGFARYADEIVDDLGSTLDDRDKERWLRSWGDAFLRDLGQGRSDDPVCRAVVDTALRWDIPREHFEAFLHSMRMDLTVTDYPTYEDLLEYVYGSAAVIGLQMVPILGARDAGAYAAAQDLGIAFQLANFVRDVGEDLDRGRVYLPLEDLERVGLSRADLERRVVDDRVRRLLAYEIARVRDLSRSASAGIPLLAPESRPCIAAAQELYVGLVDEVERIDSPVFTRRARTSAARRARVAGPAYLRALAARRGRSRSAPLASSPGR